MALACRVQEGCASTAAAALSKRRPLCFCLANAVQIAIRMAEKTITIDEVRHVAKLARLHLNADELERFTLQLGGILHYVDKLTELDVAGVEPMAHALPISTVLR